MHKQSKLAREIQLKFQFDKYEKLGDGKCCEDECVRDTDVIDYRRHIIFIRQL